MLRHILMILKLECFLVNIYKCDNILSFSLPTPNCLLKLMMYQTANNILESRIYGNFFFFLTTKQLMLLFISCPFVLNVILQGFLIHLCALFMKSLPYLLVSRQSIRPYIYMYMSCFGDKCRFTCNSKK